MDLNDASELEFEEEFRNVNFLSNAEVAVILEKTKREMEAEGNPPADVFDRTLAHAQRFSGYLDTSSKASSVQALKEELLNKEFLTLTNEGDVQTKKLHPFQIVSLLNLDPQDHDEALSLIPSLKNFSDAEIEDILTLITNSKRRT